MRFPGQEKVFGNMQVPHKQYVAQNDGGAMPVSGTLPMELAALVETGVHELAARDLFARRVLDVLGSLLFLAVAGIPMLLVAAAIKLTSRGPVFYRQERNGLNGATFLIWKFRTMTVCEAAHEVRQAQPGDPRVTTIGRFLRAHSLDELPNFINVLLGDMSLVGPRPHPVMMDKEFNDAIYGYELRQRVRPGVTGLAQICGARGACEQVDSMKNRVALDLFYAQNADLRLDLLIIFKTALLVLTGRSGYDLAELLDCTPAAAQAEFIH